MVEVMGPDTYLSLNLTEEVTELPPMEVKLRRLPTRRLWKCESADGNRIRKSPVEYSCPLEGYKIETEEEEEEESTPPAPPSLFDGSYVDVHLKELDDYTNP